MTLTKGRNEQNQTQEHPAGNFCEEHNSRMHKSPGKKQRDIRGTQEHPRQKQITETKPKQSDR